jgi:hypothetical protein
METGNGTARDGFAESGFAVQYLGGQISSAYKVNSVYSSGPPNILTIQWDGNTIAVAHTHGVNAVSEPSPGDCESPFPNFVRAGTSFYVTIPNTYYYIKLP